ncbi:MAG: NAD+ synthase [Sphingobacteriaceae bacterium]|nr:NAD+ synthase [Sphingobacteriaceae bacterium]
MKIALAQHNYHIGNFESNTKKIIEHIHLAKKNNADLIVFSELSVCGYAPQDFLAFDTFINHCETAAKHIAKHCLDIACIVGLPIKNTSPIGKKLYNAAYFIENGEIKSTVRKTLLPTYDVFDEYRYFENNRQFECISFQNKKIALTICEDLWNENHLYSVSPMDELIKQKPDLMINIAASPFSTQQGKERQHILSSNAKKYALPLLYVNQVGAQTEIIFDGGSCVFDAQGEKQMELKSFEEDFQIVNTEQLLTLEKTDAPSEIAQIHDALVLGIKDYFQKSGFSKAILGLSGGIDSAIVCVLAARALGAENVLAVLLPSQYSSDHSVKDALDLVNNLGCKSEIIPIHNAANAFEEMLSPIFKGLAPNLTEENIQSRSRGLTLMAISNKLGYVLLNTSNKSEVAVGYGTLYGDMCGAIGVIGDVYKTQIYALANYINKDEVVIPINTIVKPPSAELRPDQKDSDSLPDYDVLDSILFQYIEKQQTPSQLIEQGFDKDLVNRIIQLVNNAEFKRYQTPPILRVSNKAFGIGRMIPIVAKHNP